MGSVLLAIFLAFQVGLCFSGGFCNNFSPQCSYVHAPPIVIPVRYMALPLKGLNVIPLPNGMNEGSPNCPINLYPGHSPQGSDGCSGSGNSGGYGGPENCGYSGSMCSPRPEVPQYLNCRGRMGGPEGPDIPERPNSPGRPFCLKRLDFPEGPGCLGRPCYPGRPGCPEGPSCTEAPGSSVEPGCFHRPSCPDEPNCLGRPGYHRRPCSSDVPCGPESPGFSGCPITPCCLSCLSKDYKCIECLKKNCPMCSESSIPTCSNIPGDNSCSEDLEGNYSRFTCKSLISSTPPSDQPLSKPTTSDGPFYPYFTMPCQNPDNYCKSCIFQKGCRRDDSGIVYGNEFPVTNEPSSCSLNVVPRPSPTPSALSSPPHGCKSFHHCCNNYPHGLMCGGQDDGSDYYPPEKPSDYGPDNIGNIPPDSLQNPDVPLCAKHYLVRSVRPVFDEYIKKVPIVQKVVRHEPITTVKTVPYIKRNVVSKPERYVCQVPVIEKFKISDYRYQTKMVPCKKTRVVPTIQTVVVSLPVTERIHKPLYKEIVKHVPRVCYRMKPVVQENVIQVPIKEKTYRPVVVQRVVKVPVKSCIRKNFIEQKVHKSYGPCECCPCS